MKTRVVSSCRCGPGSDTIGAMTGMQRLLGLLAIAVVSWHPAFSQTAYPPSASASASIKAGPNGQVDINSADKAALRSIGLNDILAQRVIDNRPYPAKNRLLTRGILSRAQYAAVKDTIVAHRSRQAAKSSGNTR